MKITSKDNKTIKLFKSLQNKKHREKESMFVVENLKTIYDAFESDIYPEEILITEEILKKDGEKIKNLTNSVNIIDSKLNKQISSLDTASGAMAVYKKKEKEINKKGPIVYLNNINDPGNLGTILRSALAFGIKNIVLDDKTVDLYNPKVINAAKDSIFKLNIKTGESIAFLKALALSNDGVKEKTPIISTSLEGRSIKEGNVFSKNNFCLVLGSEAHGVDQEILEMSDYKIKIPISKEEESLNVGVAAGIIFFYIASSKAV